MILIGEPFCLIRYAKKPSIVKLEIFCEGRKYKLELRNLTEEEIKNVILNGKQKFEIG